ncbi:MAG: 3'-5' exonuclease [Turneriella sp.]|nr:3'-5' exonuclease [Turneriella sp.]
MQQWARELRFVAIDLETTGLNPYRHEIVEIGAVAFSLTGLGNEFSVLVRPENKMDPRARAVHQISSEELASKAVSLEEGIHSFVQFMGEGTWVFHNAPFDLAFLKRAFEKLKLPWPLRYYFDHLQLSRQLRAERESHALSAIKKELGIETGQAHRALADAKATALAFTHLLTSEPELLSSRKKFQKVRRWQHKTEKFRILFPENFDRIEAYFQGKIRQEALLKVEFYDKNGVLQRGLLQPLELMVFGAKVYVRGKIQPAAEELLVGLHRATFYDQELGAIKFYDEK